MSDEDWQIAGDLATQRLIVLRGSPTGTATAELVHDALIEQWPTLADHISAHRDFLEWRDDVRRRIRSWDEADRRPSQLITGRQLQQGLELLRLRSSGVSEREREYLLASQKHQLSTRRRRRIGILAALTVIIVAASATIIAVNQYHAKQLQSRIVTARRVAAGSQLLLNTNLAVAQLLAVEAYHIHQDPQTLAALFQALTASPHLVRSIQASGTISATAASGDGHVMLAGTQGGNVLKWSLAGDRIGDHEERVARLHGVITAIATNADGRIGAAIDANAVQIWPAGQYAASFGVPAGQNPMAVGVSPSGRFVVVGTEVAQGLLPPELLLFDRATGRTTHVALRDVGIYPDAIAVPNDTQIVAFNGGYGTWGRFSIPGLKRAAGSAVGLFGVHDYAAALSADGRLFSYTNAGPQLPLWTTSGSHTIDHPSLVAQTRGTSPVALALSADGSRAALADNTTIYVSRPAPPSKSPEAPMALTGAGPITRGSLAFIGSDGDRLVSASGDSLMLWDLRQYSRIGTEQSAVIPVSCAACVGPRIALQEQGGYVAIVGGDGLGVSLNVAQIGSAAPRKEPQQVLSLHNAFGGIRALWDSSGKRIILVSPQDDSAEIRSASSGLPLIGTWPAPPNPLQLPDPASLLQLMPGGRRVVEVDASGTLKIRDAATGKILREVTGPADMAPTADGAEALPQGRAALNSQATYAAVIDGNSHDIYVTDIATGDARVIHEGDASGVGFIRDRLLIQRETGALEVWNASGSNSFGTIQGTPGNVVGPVTGGNTIAETDANGTVELLDYPSGYLLATLTVPTADSATSTSLEFSPGGTQLVTATAAAGNGNTGEVVDWKIDPGTLIRVACTSAGRDITVGEWKQYIGTPIPSDLHCIQ
jgi:WD40 repeat protein